MPTYVLSLTYRCADGTSPSPRMTACCFWKATSAVISFAAISTRKLTLNSSVTILLRWKSVGVSKRKQAATTLKKNDKRRSLIRLCVTI
eukprot:m.221176 g.221176  ORF g.221176 m.221176 type:complete len:89 (-) comp33339_c0_seq1:254-520(-)